MFNGKGGGFRPKPLVSDGLVMITATASGITALVASGVSTAIGRLVGAATILVVFNRTWVGAGHTLNLLAIAVVAGILDGRACQLLL